VEREVKDRQGNKLSLRIRPYKNMENRIDGAVLALFDLETARRQELVAKQASDLLQEMLDFVEQPAVILDEDFRIIHKNPIFANEFGHDGNGSSIYQVMDGHVEIDRLRALLEEVLQQNGRIDHFELGKSDGKSGMRASARQVRRGAAQVASVVLTFSR